MEGSFLSIPQKCDVCDAIINEWVLLPACAESACNGEASLCCYNVVCRHGCHFVCVTCKSVVDESHIFKTYDGFVCDQCYQNHPVETVDLYQWWGLEIFEYVRRYEYFCNQNEFNELVQMYTRRCYDRDT